MYICVNMEIANYFCIVWMQWDRSGSVPLEISPLLPIILEFVQIWSSSSLRYYEFEKGLNTYLKYVRVAWFSSVLFSFKCCTGISLSSPKIWLHSEHVRRAGWYGKIIHIPFFLFGQELCVNIIPKRMATIVPVNIGGGRNAQLCYLSKSTTTGPVNVLE